MATDRSQTAVILAGLAALRSGAGVLQIACDPRLYRSRGHCPETRIMGPDTPELGGIVPVTDAIVIGPSLDNVEHTSNLLNTVANRDFDAARSQMPTPPAACGAESDLLHDRGRPAVGAEPQRVAGRIRHAD